MKQILILTMVFCITFLFFTFVIIIPNKKLNNFKQFLEKQTSLFSGITGYLGLVIGIISVFITAIAMLISIQEPKLEIAFTASVWENNNIAFVDTPENGLERTSDNRLFQTVAEPWPRPWQIAVKNNGNITANNIKVEIEFDNVYFQNISYSAFSDLRLIDEIEIFQKSTIIWEPKNNVDVGSGKYDLVPSLPFLQAKLFNDADNIMMKVRVSADNADQIERSFSIPIETLSITSDDLEGYVGGVEASFITLFNAALPIAQSFKYGEPNYFGDRPFDYIYMDTDSTEFEYSIDLLLCGYEYCLEQLSETSKPELKKIVLDLGRIYYWQLNKTRVVNNEKEFSVMEIESIIANDIMLNE